MALRRRHLAERLDGEPHGRRPPAGRGLELDRRLGVGGARERGQERSRLARVEDEVGAGELEHLPLAPQALDRERQLEARGEDEVEPRRRLPAERLDHLHRSARPCDRVDVVDHEDEVAAQRRLEGLAECRREAAGARGLVLLRTRACGGGDGAGGVDGERGDAQPQRVGEAPSEACERRVVGGRRVPGAVDLARPVGEHRRLAEPGAGDDDRQPALEGAVEDGDEAITPDVGRGRDRRAEPRPRGRGQAGACGRCRCGAATQANGHLRPTHHRPPASRASRRATRAGR